jgi:hypothetical protein
LQQDKCVGIFAVQKNTLSELTLFTKNKIMGQHKTPNTRTERSVANGILVIETAIAENVSLSEASRLNQFGRNYVSDVRIRLKSNLKNRNVSRNNYREFRQKLKTYNSL